MPLAAISWLHPRERPAVAAERRLAHRSGRPRPDAHHVPHDAEEAGARIGGIAQLCGRSCGITGAKTKSRIPDANEQHRRSMPMPEPSKDLS